MKRITAEDINQEMYDLYDDYVHSKIDRKKFLEKLSVYAVGGLTLPSILGFMLPNYADKLQIQPEDPRLNSGLQNIILRKEEEKFVDYCQDRLTLHQNCRE